MQERVVEERDAEPVGPSWYLSRDGEQIGPLTDRELSLFAHGGNFKPGDLLWTAGLDGWKPAEAIFRLKNDGAAEAGIDEDASAPQGVAAPQDAEWETDGESGPVAFSPDESGPSDSQDTRQDTAGDADFEFLPPPEAETPAAHHALHHDAEHDAGEPDGEDVTALVQALKGETAPPKLTLKERAIQELKAFAGAFVYLWVVFTVFLLHEWIVLSEKNIGFAFYGLATINAIALGKIIVVAEHFRFAERLREKPLIYPIAYKTVAFTTLLFVAYVIEMMLFGWIGGHGFLASVPALGGGPLGTAILWLIFCVVLMPYFAFKEFERAVGPDMIRKLLFGGR